MGGRWEPPTSKRGEKDGFVTPWFPTSRSKLLLGFIETGDFPSFANFKR